MTDDQPSEMPPDDQLGEVLSGDEQPEMPSGMERRLVLQLLSYWREICGERRYPSFSDLNPDAISDIWPSCFAMEVGAELPNAVFRAIGEAYASHSSVSLDNLRASDVPDGNLVIHSIEFLAEVMAKGVPVSRGGEFVTDEGATVLFRSIMLPMSDDGETVSGVLGAANCRMISEG